MCDSVHWESNSSSSPEDLSPALTVDFERMQMLAPGVFLQIDHLHVVVSARFNWLWDG